MEQTHKKRVIVTGASSGIGRATSEAFLKEGDQVTLVGRNEKALQEVHSLYPSSSFVVVADVSEKENCERVVKEAVAKMGGLDTLVNNAGILGNVGNNIETTTLEQWNLVIQTNVTSAFLMTQQAVPHLEKSKGSVVNVSSLSGTNSFPNLLPYCVSKAAVDQLTKCTALELAGKGIRVNAVNPATVETNVHLRGGMDPTTYENYLEESKATHPLGRVGRPEEVANLILFLASDKAEWITGSLMAIDGGRSKVCSGGKALFGAKPSESTTSK